VSDATFYVMLF